MQPRTSCADGFRISVSSTPSCSSQGTGPDDLESLGDVFLWGEIWSDGVTADGTGNPIPIKTDVLIPKPLETNVVLDVHQISCGVRHVGLVTRQGEVFTWGEESGGRLGHGIERDFSRPRLVEFLAVTNIDSIACGEFHTSALSATGDLYTWGDGTHNIGLLGQGNDISHWIPKRASGSLEGIHVLTIACGTWHSAFVTSTGKLFTFGDGMFGALGHGDRVSLPYPKEILSLSGMKVLSVSCGLWHTAAIVEVANQSGAQISSRKLFTWGDGERYRLGHGDKESRLSPTCVSSLIDYNILQIGCGSNVTASLTTSGHVFMMGSNAYGELGNPQSDGKSPCLVQERLVGEFAEQLACGAHHVAVLTSRSEVFTWGRGGNGRLGHGDTEDRNIPTLVEALKDKVVRNIACGSNYTASICIHKWMSGADQSVCTGCRQAFGFTRKRHDCYNCGLVHCHACSSKKAVRAALAPTPGKPHRVCDSCYLKLKKAAESGTGQTIRRRISDHRQSMDMTNWNRGEMHNSRVLLSPTVEPVKYLKVRSGGPGAISIVRASQVPSLLQLKDIAFPSSLSALQHGLKPSTTPSPHPMMTILPQPNSRPVSPYSRRPNSPSSNTPVFSRSIIETLKKSNDHLTQEISKLHDQVKSLEQKSETQDTEIWKLKKVTEDANASAVDKSSKCVKAMQAIKTITDQLNEISQNLPPEVSESDIFKNLQAQAKSFLETTRIHDYMEKPSLPSDIRKEQQQNYIDAVREGKEDCEIVDRANSVAHDSLENAEGPPPEANGASVSQAKDTNESRTLNQSANPHHKKLEGQQEVIEQFEPGVYVTLLVLSNGTKIYKRVRFSKRRFSEQQAEEWWKENRERLLSKYAPTKPIRMSTSEAAMAAPPPPANEANQRDNT